MSQIETLLRSAKRSAEEGAFTEDSPRFFYIARTIGQAIGLLSAMNGRGPNWRDNGSAIPLPHDQKPSSEHPVLPVGDEVERLRKAIVSAEKLLRASSVTFTDPNECRRLADYLSTLTKDQE